MPFKKGKSKTGGRNEGVQNKKTKEVRAAFKQLIEDNLDNMTQWLEDVAKDDPSKALTHIQGLSEYILPKLQRTEVVDLNKIDLTTLTSDELRLLDSIFEKVSD